MTGSLPDDRNRPGLPGGMDGAHRPDRDALAGAAQGDAGPDGPARPDDANPDGPARPDDADHDGPAAADHGAPVERAGEDDVERDGPAGAERKGRGKLRDAGDLDGKGLGDADGPGSERAPSASAAHVSPFAPLRVTAYRRLLAGNLVSALGLFLHAVAASWVMLELTGSPFMVGLVTAASFLPRLLTGMPAAALTDMLDRRSLLIWSNVGSASAALGLAVLQGLDAVTPILLITFSFLLGLGSSLSLPAYQSLVPDLLPRALVPGAVTLQSGGFNVARAVGPAVGGALVAAGRADAAFAINGVSYLFVVAAAVTFPRGDFRADSPEPVMRAMATGVRFLRHTPDLLRVVLITGLFAVTSGSVQPMLPNIAEDTLGIGASGYGLLFACFGGGALVAALTRERVSRLVRGRMVSFGIVGFGVAGVAFGLSRVAVVSGAILAVVGAFWVWTLATLNATVQLSAPRWVRGRAIGIYLLTFTGLLPVGALAAGALAEVVGAAQAVTAFCAAAGLVGLLSTRLAFPALDEIVEPSLPDDLSPQPHEAVRVWGSPVVVVTEWRVRPDDMSAFLATMRDVRRHRRRTGAYRWVLFRNAEDPGVVTEVFEVTDWDEHLRQHGRLDGEMVATLRRAQAFDRDGGPTTRHLVGIDVTDPAGPPGWESLLAVHADLHRDDGSVPLDRQAVLDEAARQRSGADAGRRGA